MIRLRSCNVRLADTAIARPWLVHTGLCRSILHSIISILAALRVVLSGRDRRNWRNVRDRLSLSHVNRLRLLRLLCWLLLGLLWLLIGFSLWRKGLSVAEDVVCNHAGTGSRSTYHRLTCWLDRSRSSVLLRCWFFKQLIFTVFTRSKLIVEALICGTSTSYQRRQRSAFGMQVADISTLVRCLVRHLLLVHISLNDHGSFWLKRGLS